MHTIQYRTRALGGAAIFLAIAGVAVAIPRSLAGPVNSAKATGTPGGVAVASVEPQPTAEASTAAADPAPADTGRGAPAPAPVPVATASEPAPDTTPDSAPAPAAAVSAPKLSPGQRVDPSSSEVQAAVAALHGRIPLFSPTEAQLRTFADAVCSSFDQGQSEAQVQSTVQDAVSRIDGASLSGADAAFAVTTVVQLRCPGWLP